METAGIWKKPISLAILNDACSGTLVEHVGIRFTDIGDDYLRATMPVRETNLQPKGLLHGGASVVLIETVCSMAGSWCAPEDRFCAGIEVNANHLKAKRSGTVTATGRPIRIGRTIQVWTCDIRDERGEMTATGRITMAVVGDGIGR
jgi:1,4-dihydroxy-2-naphthoyl-CoA hydrolase